MKKIPVIVILAFFAMCMKAQTMVATFEDGNNDQLTFDNGAWFDASLFSKAPGIYDNPDRNSLNTSAKCVGATNVANADWWGNFLVLKLASPIIITEQNRYLTFMAYRTIQPKEIRVGFNGNDEGSQIWFGKLGENSKWQSITIDLGASNMGKTLKTINFVLSCNWSEPRTGWGEASYYFDNFSFSSANIDLSTTYQTVEEFGASDCFYSDFIGKYWNDDVKQDVTKKLFSQQFDANGNPEGIGLSNWRVNVGGGSANLGDASKVPEKERRTECYLSPDGSYDWTRSAGQQYFMQRAKDFGCSDFTLFSSSIPYYFTKNGNVYAEAGETGCNLKDDNFDDFAEFLATVGTHFADAGYNIKYISPLNEPQYDWTAGAEGSPWQNANIAHIAREINTSLQNRHSNIKILLAEAGSWDCSYTGSGRANNQITDFFDSASTDYIGNLPSLEKAYGAHSYWTHSTNYNITNSRSKSWDVAKRYGIKTFQTEWSLLGDAPSTDTGFPASYDAATYMDLAMFMAKLIQCDLTVTNVSSWSYWTAFGAEQYGSKSRYYMIRLIPRDGDYGDMQYSGKAVASKNLWVLGNYSFFIRPNYKRIAMSGASEMNGLLGSSYVSPDSSRIVSVYVNTAKTITSRTVSFNGLNGKKPLTVHKYITDVTHNLALVPSQSGDYTGAAITFPARSVVTVVYDLAGPATVLDEDTSFSNPTVSSEVPLVEFNRTLDASWNALCVPFSLTGSQISDVFGAGTTVAHFTGFDGNNINFSTSNQNINANEPVLVKVTNASGCYNIANPTVSAATLPSNTLTITNGGESMSFVGVYEPIENVYTQYGNTSDLYIIADNKLLKADGTSAVSLKGFSAFFRDTNPSQTKTTVLIDGVASSISSVTVDKAISGDVYDLSGRLLNRKASLDNLRKGVYIINGKKILIK